jgi:hypothetical protein
MYFLNNMGTMLAAFVIYFLAIVVMMLIDPFVEKWDALGRF